ncbi:TetR/AcrR family transcriptional regulator (plasmid) [Deinococcus sp. KNUC1210]|uniref:TetR/AcrR family transcriptional regulator n=1 Tax=Deinococcus sp. KNUC1210 TaxID=2917691 RepID=UPI001EF0BA7B|nr:TetR/AcrR family transcriptional regulator [Deinococcus sp. KNUC1210]ULH17241.1 TetR/AcrR family transcriptional regulator [Deinococcus sp. KNUC1210]
MARRQTPASTPPRTADAPGDSSRARMVQSAASLIGSRGLNATSFSEVVDDSGAPRGSIYHHFPDGKKQLAEEAIRWTSERVLAYQGAYSGQTAAGVLERFTGMWRQLVVNSGGTAGCVVAGVAIDSGADENPLIQVVRATFQAWVSLLASQLEGAGIPAQRSTSLALTILAAMEGALILCRAEGNAAPLDAITGELLKLLPPETAERKL